MCAFGHTDVCVRPHPESRATVRTGIVLAAQWLMPALVDGKLHIIFPSCRVNRHGVIYIAVRVVKWLVGVYEVGVAIATRNEGT